MASLSRCKVRSAYKLLLSGWSAIAASVVLAQPGVSPHDSNANGAYVPTMTFEVASIRQSPPPADSYTVSASFSPHSSSFRATYLNVATLLAFAYNVRGDQIQGLPDWPAMFNVQAKSDNDIDQRLAQLTQDQENMEHQHMLQTLLADRFKLKIHWETRQGPTYDLVVAKKGPKMQLAKGESASAEEQKVWGDRPIPSLYQRGDSRVGFDFVAHGCSMSDLAETLAAQFSRPVVDRTGLKGKYDFTLQYQDARLSERGADDLNPTPTLDMAIQDQLGLKLEPAKGPIQFLVIDHIEKPSEN
jgi:uncharacterized protein (TIGR03435 family)